jgi:hypothetical protein
MSRRLLGPYELTRGPRLESPRRVSASGCLVETGTPSWAMAWTLYLVRNHEVDADLPLLDQLTYELDPHVEVLDPIFTRESQRSELRTCYRSRS